MDKRTFLKSAGLMGLGATLNFAHLRSAVAAVEGMDPKQVAGDEDFWRAVRGDYSIKPDYINLENGYYCFMPQQTLEHQIQHMRRVNYEGSYYMRNSRQKNKRLVAARIGEIVGCTADEIAITRNTTESLDLIIGGMNWKEGDEAVMAEQDYGAMLNHFKFVARRYGVVNRLVSVPNHPRDDEEIVDLYASAITDKTRLLMVCHMINITGQVLPIRKICDMAHARGVEVMVDGAHAFGQINFSIKDLDCDYYGTSLHKWLSVPLGAGFLYVKKGKSDQIWPLFAEDEREPDDISRLNHTGTHPVHTDLAIANAIDYHNMIGGERKEARLRYIQNYWTSRVRDLSHVLVNTPKDKHRSCAIANVGIKGMKPSDLSKTLLDKYKIWTVAINRDGVYGCRITPNVYTTTDELDVFVAALKDLA